MAKKPVEHKVDLFRETLPALYSRDMEFYDKLPDENKSEIAPPVLMRWLSCIPSHVYNDQLILVNSFVNKNYSELFRHPDLMWRLMAASTIYNNKSKMVPRAEWIAKPSAKKTFSKLEKLILTIKPDLNNDELQLFMGSLTRESLEYMLKDMGLDDGSIKDYLKEFKK